MINIDKFISIYKQHYNINTKQQQGILNILNNFNNDLLVNQSIPRMAYILATIFWETDQKMFPSKEVRQIRTDTPRRKQVRKLQDRYWYTGFYGRGYCHLTWLANYRMMSKVLVDEAPDGTYVNSQFLVLKPDLAYDPDISYKIIVLGMLRGCFNGKGHGLGHYVDKTPPDYVGARYTVNIQDQAQAIADIAKRFEGWIKDCWE